MYAVKINGVMYNSMSDAASALNIAISVVSARCRSTDPYWRDWSLYTPLQTFTISSQREKDRRGWMFTMTHRPTGMVYITTTSNPVEIERTLKRGKIVGAGSYVFNNFFKEHSDLGEWNIVKTTYQSMQIARKAKKQIMQTLGDKCLSLKA